ncbi:MAG TPA: lamin tail domain-containing protein [Verrucomicrobiae bacterium]
MKSLLWGVGLGMGIVFASSAADPQLSRARQLSPSSRGTPLIISEIMYHPREPGGTEVLEYIEIFNTEPVSEIISGYRISGAVDFTFPANTSLPGRSFVVVAREPAALRQAAGIDNVIGPFAGSLPNDGGRVRLSNRAGALLLEVNYQDQMPWPVAADGAGHSLQLARPDYGEGSVEAWSASALVGGSPGRADPEVNDPLDAVVINEFLGHTDLPQVDFIELFNRGTAAVDISGCGLSDQADTNKFTIPAGTVLSPRAWRAFSATDLGFPLSTRGEAIFLTRADSTRVIDAVRFGAQRNGVSSGRWPDGAPGIRELAQTTPGASNSPPTLHDIVINEIMFHPISGQAKDEYVELYNRGANPVDVGYWRFVDGIAFMIPPGTVIPAGGYLVVARDRANVLSKYPQLNAVNTVGDYTGELSDHGERLVLASPDDLRLPFQDFVIVDEVTYSDGWGRWSDGGGSSLELIDAHADNALGPNWEGSDETAKAPWTDIEYTGVIDNQAGTMEELQVFCPQSGECLLDKIELQKAGEAINRVNNSDFESGLSGWELLGSHERSSLETTEGYASNRSLHVRATSQGRCTISIYRITYDRLSTPVAPPLPGETFTIRAKGRWIAGWPYIVIGVKGHALEAVGALALPPNLGTPGLPNSRRVANAGPAIYHVQHAPVLPAAGQAVVVSARVYDPDRVASVLLKWRNDTAASPVTTTPMTDPDGDGVFRATLPGQAAGQIVAFAVEASDAAASPATSRFPGPPRAGTPPLECLVRFGDTLAPGVFGTYRMWVSSTNVARWLARETRSNEPVDTTFTYDDFRTVYNADVHYRGNWRTYGFDDYRTAAYLVEFPKTERVLGDTQVAIDYISLNQDNGTKQQEKHAYWMARQVDLMSIAMRYVHVSVNGSAVFRYDSLLPSRTLCTSFYGDDDPHVYEQLYPHEPFGNYTTTGGAKKQAKYRYCMRKKSTTVPDDDFSSLYRVIDALAAPTDDLYVARVAALADIRSWAGYWVINRMCGNSDHYNSAGYPHNIYTYLPPYERSRLHANDLDGAFLTTYSLFPEPGYLPGVMFAKPEFRRVYWRLACDMVQGPMDPAVSGVRLNEWYQVFLKNGITAVDPSQTSAWITARRDEYHLAVAPMTNVAFRVLTPDTLTSVTPITVGGEAPVAVTTIEINGQPHAIKWVGETNWQIRVALSAGVNVLAFRALDERGAVVGSDSRTVTYTGPAVSLQGKLVISEIMYHPAAPSSSFIEIHNLSSTETLPLGGLRVDGVDATIGHGRFIGPGGYAVIAGSLPGYQSTYGNAEVVVAEFDGTLANGGETLTLQVMQGTNWTVLDQVTYSDDPPWPTAADGGGASLQLIDPAQDNARVANWAAVTSNTPAPPAWHYAVATGTATSSSLYVYLQAAGDVYLDDMDLVAGQVAEKGPSVLANGDFENAFPGPWVVSPNHAASGLSSTVKHAGQYSLHLVASSGGSSRTSSVYQDLSPALVTGQPYTLSYWYRSGSNGGTLTLRLSGSGISSTVTVPSENNTYAGGATPGGSNAVQRLLPSFPLLWLNEVQPDNVSGPLDGAGHRHPWVELYNAGASNLALARMALTDDYAALAKWAFPSNTVIQPGQFLVVWCSGDTNETTGMELHTSFPLRSGTGSVVLSRWLDDGTLQVLDYLNYTDLPANRSYGDLPDGQPFNRRAMFYATPGGTNDATEPSIMLFINEWMASNTRTLPNPVGGAYDDWFELYNPNSFAVDLTGWSLANSYTNPTQNVIPSGYFVPALGYRLIWADGKPSRNSPSHPDLHIDFKLNRDGETIALYAPDGRLVDGVTFGLQASDVSEGRYPAGGAYIYPLSAPTPGTTNLFVPPAPAFSGIERAGTQVTLTYTTTPGFTYRCDYRDQLDGSDWIPLTPPATAMHPTSTSIDSLVGSPQRFYRVVLVP